MSWDDLVQTMAQGALRPQDQVRREDEGWQSVSAVEGLRAAAAASLPSSSSSLDDPAATSWYCDVFGAELGPMTWRDLQDMAHRGILKGDNRVRSQRTSEWIDAASLVGLAWSPGSSPDDDTEFEVDAALGRSDADEETDFEVSVSSATVPSPSDTDFEISAATLAAAGDDTDFDVNLDPPV